jgi:hypothetical protein
MKHQSQLLWYPRYCFLSPTKWQPLFIATATSWQPLFTLRVDTRLLPLQVYQHTKIMYNAIDFTLNMAIRFWPPSPRLLPKTSNYQHISALFNPLMSLRKFLMPLFSSMTSCERWIVVKQMVDADSDSCLFWNSLLWVNKPVNKPVNACVMSNIRLKLWTKLKTSQHRSLAV